MKMGANGFGYVMDKSKIVKIYRVKSALCWSVVIWVVVNQGSKHQYCTFRPAAAWRDKETGKYKKKWTYAVHELYALREIIDRALSLTSKITSQIVEVDVGDYKKIKEQLGSDVEIEEIPVISLEEQNEKEREDEDQGNI
jgi:hypothetical protein